MAWVQAKMWSILLVMVSKESYSTIIMSHHKVFLFMQKNHEVYIIFKGIRTNIPAVRVTALRTSHPLRIKTGGITKKGVIKIGAIKTRAGATRTKTEAPTS